MNIKNILDKQANILLAFILLIGFYIYYPSTAFDFLINFDDDRLILDGISKNSLNWEGIKRVFSESVYGLYHPITSLTWLIEGHFFGKDSFVFHLDNILIHLINAVLVFRLSISLFKEKSIGLIVSLLFVIHPMHVENIAWLSSRKDLVYGFFFLLSLLQYLKYLKSKRNNHLIFSPVSYTHLTLPTIYSV